MLSIIKADEHMQQLACGDELHIYVWLFISHSSLFTSSLYVLDLPLTDNHTTSNEHVIIM